MKFPPLNEEMREVFLLGDIDKIKELDEKFSSSSASSSSSSSTSPPDPSSLEASRKIFAEIVNNHVSKKLMEESSSIPFQQIFTTSTALKHIFKALDNKPFKATVGNIKQSGKEILTYSELHKSITRLVSKISTDCKQKGLASKWFKLVSLIRDLIFDKNHPTDIFKSSKNLSGIFAAWAG